MSGQETAPWSPNGVLLMLLGISPVQLQERCNVPSSLSLPCLFPLIPLTTENLNNPSTATHIPFIHLSTGSRPVSRLMFRSPHVFHRLQFRILPPASGDHNSVRPRHSAQPAHACVSGRKHGHQCPLRNAPSILHDPQSRRCG